MPIIASLIQELIASADVIDVVGRHVQLKRCQFKKYFLYDHKKASLTFDGLFIQTSLYYRH
jgi:hypothetical protein